MLSSFLYKVWGLVQGLFFCLWLSNAPEQSDSQILAVGLPQCMMSLGHQDTWPKEISPPLLPSSRALDNHRQKKNPKRNNNNKKTKKTLDNSMAGKIILLLHWIAFVLLSKNQLGRFVYVYFWALFCVPLVRAQAFETECLVPLGSLGDPGQVTLPWLPVSHSVYKMCLQSPTWWISCLLPYDGLLLLSPLFTLLQPRWPPDWSSVT